MLSIRIEEKDVDYNNALTNRNINKIVKKRNVSIFYLTRYVRISIFISFFFSFSLRDIYRSYQREFSFLHTYIYIYISLQWCSLLFWYIIYLYYICFSVVSFINRCAPRRGTPSVPKDLIVILTSRRENRRSVRHRSFWRRTGTRGTLIRSSGWRAGVEVISRIFLHRRAKLRDNNPPGRHRSSHGAGSLPGWISVLEPRDWRVL